MDIYQVIRKIHHHLIFSNSLFKTMVMILIDNLLSIINIKIHIVTMNKRMIRDKVKEQNYKD